MKFSANRLCAAAWLLGAALGLGLAAPMAADAAQIAASIEYDFVSRPAGLPTDFAPAEGTTLRYLSIHAIDGNPIAAALWQPATRTPAQATLIIMVHGSGGNNHSPPQSTLPPLLAASGYATLAIDTRQHDANINTDNFFDIALDIDAAVQVARALGYQRLVLQGHSLGNIQVQFYAATHWAPDIKAVILLGPFANLPWKTQNILVQNDALFGKLVGQAQQALRAGTPGETLSDKMPYTAGATSAVTAQHFLTYRWDKTSVADGTFWIGRIPDPVLLVRDQADGVVLPFEPQMLVSAADAPGSLNTSTTFVLLPNAHPPSFQGHLFVGDAPALAQILAHWLAVQKL